MASEVGNSVGLVSGVYLAVLIPWGVLYYHDFISETWNTISKTRRDGWIHVGFICVPMSVLLVYIVFQPKPEEPDYKEMYAAIIALVLSGYHLLRSIWGLAQLHYFRKWAIEAALAMESASYVCRLNFSDQLQKGSSSKPSSIIPSFFKSFYAEHFKQTQKNPPDPCKPIPQDSFDASGNIKAASLIRPQDIESGTVPPENSARCRCADRENRKRDKKDRNRVARIVDCMLINNSVIDNEIFHSSAPLVSILPGGRMHPRRPDSHFVKWSVAYLAQFGKEWLRDSSSSPYDTDTWEGRRWHLATEVWATAALRMETECSNMPAALRKKINVSRGSLLSPDLWCKLIPSRHDQIFTKARVLRQCYEDGRGLPYDYPMIREKEPIPSHAFYRPVIKEAIAEVPPRLYDGIENITPEQLEWFAIFIWIKKWGGCPLRGTRTVDLSSDHAMDNSEGRHKRPKSSDLPVRILQDQLGLQEPPGLHRCPFPLVRQGYGRYLWNNQTLLQVSARIDNWVALCVGQQVLELMNKENPLKIDKEKFKDAHACEPDSSGSSQEKRVRLPSPGPVSRTRRIFDFHRQMEHTRLRYQLINYKARHSHLEQGLTFMGCIYEVIRSSIAESRHSHADDSDESWCPEVPSCNVCIDISSELWNCLKHVARSEHKFDSTVQERMLWECQNGVYHQLLQRLRDNPLAAPQKLVEGMMLVVLGFPSICILLTESISNEVVFKVWPIVGPQSFKVFVNMSLESGILTMQLLPDSSRDLGSSAALFRWQDWRDAFEGRLSGKSDWQNTHYMRKLRIHHTEEKISRGISPMTIGNQETNAAKVRKAYVWEGWRPFRAGMTLFELRHSSLIVVGDSMPSEVEESPTTSEDQQPEHTRADTVAAGISAYDSARPPELSDASLYLDALLKLSSSIFKDRRAGSPLPEGSPPPSPGPSLTDLSDDEVSPEAIEVSLPLSPGGLSDMEDFSDLHDRLRTRAENHGIQMELSKKGKPKTPGSAKDGENKGTDDSDRTTPKPSSKSRSGESKGMLKMDRAALRKMEQARISSIVARAQEQEPDGMHELAELLLARSARSRNNRTKALLLMERALVIGHSMKTAKLFVKTILDRHHNGDSDNMDEDFGIDRALKVVKLLWRNIEGRHKCEMSDGRLRRVWQGPNAKDENERLKALIRLHMKLVNERRTAPMMRDLADLLSRYGKTYEDEQNAIALYESAIIASLDLKAMRELGLKFALTDPKFAVEVYHRAEITSQMILVARARQEYGIYLKEFRFLETRPVLAGYRRRGRGGDRNADCLVGEIEAKFPNDPTTEELFVTFKEYHDSGDVKTPGESQELLKRMPRRSSIMRLGQSQKRK